MAGNRVKVGIVGLGRWAKVLTRAARQSDVLEIVAGFSRGEESRASYGQEFGIATVPELGRLLGDPQIKGVILTVPNEQHLPLAREVAKAGKHVYTEKPIAATLGGRPRDRGAGDDLWRHRHRRPQRPPDGRHPQDPRSDRRGRTRPRRLHGGEFLQRARAGTHAENLALVQGPRAGRAAVAARDPPFRRAALSRRRGDRGKLDGVEALAGRRRGRRPVDDDAPFRGRQDRLCRLVLDLARHFLRCACSARRG